MAMRWFTCTPVEFGGAADFFARDSGLLCRGFQALGIESSAVMPGRHKAEDEADLLRTDYLNLESSDWWKSLQLDGVVLYAWGRPRFRKVAAAIREAGVFLVLNQDNGGLVSPLAGWGDWLKEQWILAGQGVGLGAWLRSIKLVLRGLTVGLTVTDPLRAAHLKCGNVIACVSPKAADYYRRLCWIYGGHELSRRVAVVPHGVEPRFRYTGVSKRRQVVCVGRWQDTVQKRPQLLMAVLSGLLAADEVSVVIAGRVTNGMKQWHQSLAGSQRDRVKLVGIVERDELQEHMNASQVFYSSSAFESFGIAAAESLCCGCSVVAGRAVSMVSFEWFVAENSGALAVKDSVQDHLRVLQEELARWESGEREPRAISAVWCERLHADRVAARVVAMGKVHGAEMVR